MSKKRPSMTFLHAWEIYAQVPMKVKTVLPDPGFGPMMIKVRYDGTEMWVECLPKQEPGAKKRGSFRHRLMCTCDKCGKLIPYGRMNQHYPVHFKTKEV